MPVAVMQIHSGSLPWTVRLACSMMVWMSESPWFALYELEKASHIWD